MVWNMAWHRWLVTLVALSSLWMTGCGGTTDGETGNNAPAPCGGLCPPEQCVFGSCAEDNNASNDNEPDMGVSNNDPGDAVNDDVGEDAAEDDADGGADVDEPEEDVEGGCPGDGACEEGEICDDTLSPPACREGCRVRSDCAPGEFCEPMSLTCIEGCGGDDDCGPPESLLACDPDTRLCVSVECRVDLQCEGGQYCDTVEGVCADGCREGECLPGEFCDLNTRECVFGCQADDDCGPGLYCDEPTNTCFEGCRGDEECGEGEVCELIVIEDDAQRQRCVADSCESDADCADDAYCGPDPQREEINICQIGCRSQPDNCAEGEVCDGETRRCVLGCAEDGDCGEGFICVPGEPSSCQPGCREDESCAEGQRCLVEELRCSCLGNNDCVQGQVCEQGACTPSCESSEDCDEGQSCDPLRLVCVTSCGSDADCEVAEGFVCDLGAQVCVPQQCTIDAECPGGKFCDTRRQPSICLSGCRIGECPQEQFCDVDARICQDGCLNNDNCSTGTYCDLDEGACLEGCRGSDECPAELTCELVTVDEGVRARCVLPVCASDGDCGAEEFCGPTDIPERDACQLGCRTEPDNCLGDSLCNPITRTCTEVGCESDEICGQGEICDLELDPSTCRAGCRDDGSCNPGQRCDEDTAQCTCVGNEDCAGVQVCLRGLCVDPCSSDADCGDGEICNPQTRQCEEGCGGDDDCPEGFVCDIQRQACLGRLCAQDDNCAQGQFCNFDAEQPRCAVGCRQGGCGFNEFCDVVTRECEAGCANDGGCQPGDYCEVDINTCVEGCRDAGECAFDEVCDRIPVSPQELRQRCVPPTCADDDACRLEEYCGLNADRQRNECQPGCRTELDNCPPTFACNAQTRQCESTVCNQDVDCGQGRICVEDNGQNLCRVGCRDDQSCPGQSTCNLVSLTCTCEVSDDCGEGQVCDEGTCIAPCGSDDECEEGLVCSPGTGLCAQGCTFDGECGGREFGFICNQQTRTCEQLTCLGDNDCPELLYCDTGQNPGLCELGCRLDGCPFGQICEQETRTCVPGCQTDEECLPGQYCDLDDNVCEFGCRNNDDCAQPGVSLVCDLQDTRECIGSICEVDESCGEQQFCPDEGAPRRCELGCRPGLCPEGQFCDVGTRLCEEGCNEDLQCPEGFFCDVDNNACRIGCRDDDECLVGEACVDILVEGELERICQPASCDSDLSCFVDQYCGFDEQLQFDTCQVGCRLDPDNCPEGSSCDPNSRQCLDGLGCDEDAQCGVGEICFDDGFSSACVPGCREDAQCGDGQLCDVDGEFCTCGIREDCPDSASQTCSGGACVAACQRDADCLLPEESCDVDSGLCFQGGCLDDEFEPNENIFQAPPLFGDTTLSLKMCYLEPPPENALDCFALDLFEGTFNASATFSHAQGNLDLVLYDSGGFVVSEARSVNDNETLEEVIEFAAFYTLCVEPVGDPFENSYTLQLTLP